MPEELITTAQASKISGYHQEYIRRLLKEGRIEGIKFGYVWQVKRTSFLNYLDLMQEKGSRRGPKKKD